MKICPGVIGTDKAIVILTHIYIYIYYNSHIYQLQDFLK